MLFLGGILIFSSIIGCFLTIIMGRRLVKSINFLVDQGKLEINSFNLLGFDKSIKVEPE